MSTDIPEWFKGARPAPDVTNFECPKCGAPPGERCRYTVAVNMHADPETGQWVENVIGQQMIRSHRERYQAREASHDQ